MAYTGPHCDQCALGYHDEDGECELNESCQADSCYHNGTCDDSSGEIECTCNTGYAGEYCDHCADGYQQNQNGQCVEETDCDPSVCNYHGSCEQIGGQTVCHCSTGYAGTHCERCAAGYHLDGDECVDDEQCMANSCNQHGDCDDSTGVVQCSCHLGYAGAHCDDCMDGFEENDQGQCVPTQPEDCGDGVDNDNDGDTDCQDLECALDERCGVEDCTDTFDNDGDEKIDCRDPDCMGDPDCEVCSTTTEVFCGDVVTGGTTGTDTMSVYPSCSDWEETGPEAVYVFEAPADSHVDAVLTGMSADLDIFVLENTCNPNTCKEQGESHAWFGADIGILYYIVVDGYDGEQGSFTLTITCE
jgi:hypothetical protein